jgi:hypothetical protein
MLDIPQTPVWTKGINKSSTKEDQWIAEPKVEVNSKMITFENLALKAEISRTV